MGWIGSAVLQVAPKRLPGIWFFQLQWVLNILCEIHCFFCLHIFWVYYFGLSKCALFPRSNNKFRISDYRFFTHLERVLFVDCCFYFIFLIWSITKCYSAISSGNLCTRIRFLSCSLVPTTNLQIRFTNCLTSQKNLIC